MTLAEMIAAAQEELRTAITARQSAQDALMALRNDPNLTEQAVADATATRDAAHNTVTARQERLDSLLTEQAREKRWRRCPSASRRPRPARPAVPGSRPSRRCTARTVTPRTSVTCSAPST